MEQIEQLRAKLQHAERRVAQANRMLSDQAAASQFRLAGAEIQIDALLAERKALTAKCAALESKVETLGASLAAGEVAAAKTGEQLAAYREQYAGAQRRSKTVKPT